MEHIIASSRRQIISGEKKKPQTIQWPLYYFLLSDFKAPHLAFTSKSIHLQKYCCLIHHFCLSVTVMTVSWRTRGTIKVIFVNLIRKHWHMIFSQITWALDWFVNLIHTSLKTYLKVSKRHLNFVSIFSI